MMKVTRATGPSGKKGVKALSDENTLPDIQVSTGLTLGGLGAGLLAGLAAERWPGLTPLRMVIEPVGALWLKALEMTILPLVSALLVVGVVTMMAAASAGRQAMRTLGWIFGLYFASAGIAAVAMPLLLDLWPVPLAAQGALSGAVVKDAPIRACPISCSRCCPRTSLRRRPATPCCPVLPFSACSAWPSRALARSSVAI
jgi:hypothetical protein